MLLFKPKKQEPELLPGANPESDCQTSPPGHDPEPTAVSPGASLDDEHDDHEHNVTWEGLEGSQNPAAGEQLARWQPARRPWALWLEKIALALEKPVNRLAGTRQLNPLYHTGTIAFFLLLIVGLTGFYLFIFFQYGFEASYASVARYETQPIARVMRAVHRYASGALVVTTLLHALRTLFMERFRGPRWLAWVTGVLLTAIIWLAGVTGYWLIWDQRAQLITDSFVGLLQATTGLAPAFVVWMRQAAETGQSWPLLFAILAVHVLLFVISGLFFYLHIKRLKRPQWLPEVQWTVSLVVVLILVSAIFPAGMLPAATGEALPAQVTLDPIFLFFLPTAGTLAAWALWGTLAALTLGFTLLPWLSKEKTPLPKVNIIKERCTGCTKCALDCPYGAIEMVERHDGKPHKFIAIEDPGLCVSCGICVGSCDGVAVTLGDTPPVFLWETVQAQLALAQARTPEGQVKVIFTCERHARHGARPYLAAQAGATTTAVLADTEIITLPCVGTTPPDLLKRTLDAGAAEVKVVGCPPGDCANREGNLWAEQRLLRKRVPRLRRAYAQAPVTAQWLAPNEFDQALRPQNIPIIEKGDGSTQPDYLTSRRMRQPLNRRHFAVAFGMLAVVMVVQVLLTDLPFAPARAGEARLAVVLSNPAAPFGGSMVTAPESTLSLTLEVDNEVVWTRPYPAEDLFAEEAAPVYERVTLPAGERQIRLAFTDEAGSSRTVLYDERATLAGGDILTVAPEFASETYRRGDAELR